MVLIIAWTCQSGRMSRPGAALFDAVGHCSTEFKSPTTCQAFNDRLRRPKQAHIRRTPPMYWATPFVLKYVLSGPTPPESCLESSIDADPSAFPLSS